jgi:hypothetical protein
MTDASQASTASLAIGDGSAAAASDSGAASGGGGGGGVAFPSLLPSSSYIVTFDVLPAAFSVARMIDHRGIGAGRPVHDHLTDAVAALVAAGVVLPDSGGGGSGGGGAADSGGGSSGSSVAVSTGQSSLRLLGGRTKSQIGAECGGPPLLAMSETVREGRHASIRLEFISAEALRMAVCRLHNRRILIPRPGGSGGGGGGGGAAAAGEGVLRLVLSPLLRSRGHWTCHSAK